MLELHFKNAKRLRNLRGNAFHKYTDSLAKRLHQIGYSKSYCRRILTKTGQFFAFIHAAGVQDIAQINAVLVKRFIEDKQTSKNMIQDATRAMHHMMEYLQHLGVNPKHAQPRPEDPFSLIDTIFTLKMCVGLLGPHGNNICWAHNG